MGEKVTTIMVLKVDLQCHRCYKKVKKVLCKFPQIQDQTYDEKQNTVTIKVVCCSPEKIKQKIICKGGDSVQSIEIKLPPKTKQKPEDPEPKKPEDPNPKKVDKQLPPPTTEPQKPPEPAALPERPIFVPGFPIIGVCCRSCHEGCGRGPCYPGFPIGVRCRPCHEGCGWGPCCHGHRGIPPCFGRPVYDSYGGGCYKPCHVCRCGYYFCEENPSGCTTM